MCRSSPGLSPSYLCFFKYKRKPTLRFSGHEGPVPALPSLLAKHQDRRPPEHIATDRRSQRELPNRDRFTECFPPFQAYVASIADNAATTAVSGNDPKDWHGIIAFKTSEHLLNQYHVTSHGYTNGKDDFILKDATYTIEKPDNTRRGGVQSKKVVWPHEEFLEEYTDSHIGNSDLPGQG